MTEEVGTLVTAAVTAAITAVAAWLRNRRRMGASATRIAELEHERSQGESGRLWDRVTVLEAKIEALESSRHSCLDKLRAADARIVILEDRLSAMESEPPASGGGDV